MAKQSKPKTQTEKTKSAGKTKRNNQKRFSPVRAVRKLLSTMFPKPKKPAQVLVYLFWLLPVGMLAILYVWILKDLPSPTKLRGDDVALATKIYDRNGKHLYDIFGDENRTQIPLSDIPKHVQESTIAIEDKNFYSHQGINPIGGILRALSVNIRGERLQGGSTITQQLVKSALLTPERTVTRKVREIILAIAVEILYTKDQILEMYLNQVPYGGTAWGIQAAAEKYFGKNAKDLTLAEGSLLAGLPQAPTLYSPFGAHPEFSKTRQKAVLRRMVEDGYITQEEADRTFDEPLVYKQETNIQAPHFVMYVKQKLVDTYGEALVELGGLQVRTTLDLDLQKYAEASVSGEITELTRYNVTNGAALITKPATGEILAMVGSTDYFATPSGSFNVTTALRQPGSSIKPINYAIGIEKRIVTPATVFVDTPTCFSVTGQPAYCPVNYDGSFHGPVTLRASLANSYNIPAVKMLYLNTVEDMVASASAFGIDTFTDPKNYGLSLTLGGGEVHMTDMAEAFGVFANGGIRRDLVSILSVTDRHGQVLEEFQDPNRDKTVPSQLLIRGEQAVSAETAFLISHILSDNNARMAAFGSRSALEIPGHTVSVKTGTTDDLRDNWTIGYTPQYLVVTWVGNNDNSPMMRSIVSGVTGAAPIWNALMKKVLEGQPDIEPKKPDGITGSYICAFTGVTKNDNTEASEEEITNAPSCSSRYEYYIKDTPPKNQITTRALLVYTDTGEMAPSGTTENVEPQEHSVIYDGVSVYCLDCPNQNMKPVVVSY